MWDKVVKEATPILILTQNILIINELFVTQPYSLPTLCIENKRTDLLVHSLVSALITKQAILQVRTLRFCRKTQR